MIKTLLPTNIYIFLRKHSFNRSFNFLKLKVSYLLTRLLGRPILFGYPATLSVEPTNRCNLQCPECLSGSRSLTRNAGFINDQTYDKILSEVSSFVNTLILYFQGEPLLHPDIFNLIRKAHEKKIIVIISSNGHFIDPENARKIVESGLDKIIISLDGMDQEVYTKYRVGGNLGKVKKGIEDLVEWKHRLNSLTPLIIIQFLVLSHNQHQINDVRRWGREIGVNEVQLKSAQLIDFRTGNKLMPDDRYSRYKRTKDGIFNVKSALKDYCWRTWSTAVITWDGMVVPCCFDKDATHSMGNILDSSFIHIWKDTPYRKFRNTIVTNRKTIPICLNCTEGLSISV
ncbi:MAG: SPASM domain-containing protein [Bacteroidales bacterium]|nr:MAG: SPASM domain-containing protein [Bacteroidales bacterium]